MRVSVICHYAEQEVFIKMWLPRLTSKLEEIVVKFRVSMYSASPSIYLYIYIYI